MALAPFASNRGHWPPVRRYGNSMNVLRPCLGLARATFEAGMVGKVVIK
jgi:hypothetical protein